MAKKADVGPVPGVAVIGLGNWGTSLALALHSADLPLREAIDSSPSGGRAAPRPRGLKGLPVTNFDRARLDAEILWLCVPDSSIEKMSRRLVARAGGGASGLKGRIVVHSSGALNAGILKQAARAGASVASVHPVMSFPTRMATPLTGVPFGVEAEAAPGRKLNAIIRRLGGEPFPIPGPGKALYHAAGMLTSPLLVSLVAAAQQTAELAGLSPRQARRILGPIVRATIENIFTRGLGESFSGPIARGDRASIHLHLQALKPHPMLAGVYRSLALYALEALPAGDVEEISRLLKRSF